MVSAEHVLLENTGVTLLVLYKHMKEQRRNPSGRTRPWGLLSL
jgi:hypothetical protein